MGGIIVGFQNKKGNGPPCVPSPIEDSSSCWYPRYALREAYLILTISIRRFWARPSGVSFEATGSFSPNPTARSREASIP